MISIEKNIPFPKVSSTKYPFLDLEVGDSFFVPDMITSKMSSYIQRFRLKYPDRKWAVRKVVGGIRVWRIQ